MALVGHGGETISNVRIVTDGLNCSIVCSGSLGTPVCPSGSSSSSASASSSSQNIIVNPSGSASVGSEEPSLGSASAVKYVYSECSPCDKQPVDTISKFWASAQRQGTYSTNFTEARAAVEANNYNTMARGQAIAALESYSGGDYYEVKRGYAAFNVESFDTVFIKLETHVERVAGVDLQYEVKILSSDPEEDVSAIDSGTTIYTGTMLGQADSVRKKVEVEYEILSPTVTLYVGVIFSADSSNTAPVYPDIASEIYTTHEVAIEGLDGCYIPRLYLDLGEYFAGILIPARGCGDLQKFFAAVPWTNTLGVTVQVTAATTVSVDSDLEIDGVIFEEGLYPVGGCTPPQNGSHSWGAGKVFVASVAPGQTIVIDIVDGFGVGTGASGILMMSPV